jgi:DNA polymerase V
MLDLEIHSSTTAAPLLLAVGPDAHAGFPSPAADYIEQAIDLNSELVKRPASTFLARVKGDSMRDAGIHEGDILVVDRSLRPENGRTALCWLDGEFTLKRLEVTPTGVRLLPANPAYPAIAVEAESQFTVWGIVAYVIHKL